MADPIWIARIDISQQTANKLRQYHSINPQEVIDELLCVPGITYSDHVHPQYGRRALIHVTIRERRVLVVLFPTIDPGTWNLGSAYYVN